MGLHAEAYALTVVAVRSRVRRGLKMNHVVGFNVRLDELCCLDSIVVAQVLAQSDHRNDPRSQRKSRVGEHGDCKAAADARPPCRVYLQVRFIYVVAIV